MEPGTSRQLESTWGYTEAACLTVGGLLTLLAVIGFFVTGFDDFARSTTDEHLLGLDLNPLHNLLHLVTGLAGLVMWSRFRWAVWYGALLLVVYGGAVLFGIAARDEEWDVLALDGVGMGMHLLLAGAGFVIVVLGFWEARSLRRWADPAATGDRVPGQPAEDASPVVDAPLEEHYGSTRRH